MSEVPVNEVFEDGVVVLSGARMNSLMQTALIASDLRAFVGIDTMTVFLSGINRINDGNGGFFRWDSNATGPDNNSTIIMPYDSEQGAWLRTSISGTLIPATPAIKKIVAADSPYLLGVDDGTVLCDTTGGAIVIDMTVFAATDGNKADLVNIGTSQVSTTGALVDGLDPFLLASQWDSNTFQSFEGDVYIL